MSITPNLSELRANLYFGLTGTNYVYMHEPSSLSLVVKDYNGTKNTTYLSFDTISNIVNIPTGAVLEITNANITNLTVINFTGGRPFGIRGSTGLLGYQGFQGSQGFNGRQGLRGFQNSIGLQGVIGYQGRNVGPQGFQGFQGIQGLQGDTSFQLFNSQQDRLLLSNNTVTGALSQSNLIYTSTNNLPFLTVQGDISATGLYIESTINYTGGAINLNPTKTQQFLDLYGRNADGSFATKISGSNNDFGNSIAVDSEGNSYITGYYNPPTTIYNSDNTTFVVLSGSGANDCYILNYNSTGMGKWYSRISGGLSDIGNGIGLDSEGSVYVTGSYTPPSTIYNSDGTPFRTLSGSGSDDCFVVKFGPTGMGTWATRISGVSNDVGRGQVALDTLGNSYVTGSYTQPATVYNSDGTSFRTLSGSGSNDCFIVKYGTTGMASYTTKISGTSSDVGYSIAVDSLGNSYVGGSFTSRITIYNSDNTAFTSVSSSGSTDGFLVKYGITGIGNYLCRIASSSTTSDYITAVVVDDYQNAYVTGIVIARDTAGTVFNSDGSVFKTFRSGSSFYSTYLLKYGPTGMGQYFNSIYAEGLDCNSYSLAKDNLNNIYVTCAGADPNRLVAYNSNGTIFPAPKVIGTPGSTLIKYNSTGMAQCTSVVTCSANQPCFIYGIGCDNFGNSYITGSHVSSPVIVFNSDNNQYKTLSNSGGFDIFLVKYSPDYVLMDLNNISSNNGKVITVNSTDTTHLSKILVETQSNIIYATYFFTYYISFVFYNGSWYVLAKS